MPEINKSQAIRDYYKLNRKATTQEVIDALAKKGITVSVGLVTNVKSNHNKRQAAKRAARGQVAAATKTTDKKSEVNKTQAVRDYLKQHRNARSDEVVAALKAEGITVSASLVRNIKTKSKRRRKAAKEVVSAAPTGIGVKQIKEALSFIKTVGSIDAARQALAAAVEIKRIV